MITGFWIGSEYGFKGERWDYAFDLLDDGKYNRRIRTKEEAWKIEEGTWNYDGSIHFKPTGNPIGPTGYSTYLINRFEDCRSILVIRPIIFATPNLPIILYRDFISTFEAEQSSTEQGGAHRSLTAPGGR